MHTTHLLDIGGSVMLPVPPAILKRLQLHANATVGLVIDDDYLRIKPVAQPRYTMAELLADSDYTQPQPPQEREWVDAPAAGGELV